MDASLSRSPWQLAVSRSVGDSTLAELLHTCLLTNKERSRAASCGEDTLVCSETWDGANVLKIK